jgi:hypothetical protein
MPLRHMDPRYDNTVGYERPKWTREGPDQGRSGLVLCLRECGLLLLVDACATPFTTSITYPPA